MPDERIRLFVALELPLRAREALARWGEQAMRRQRLRALSTDSLHVTLCFLGWQDADGVEAIAAACGGISGQPAPRLSLGDPRWLPPHRPRVLAIELRDRDGDLARVQGLLSQLLAAGGWHQPEKRPYLAHVTVARVAPGAGISGAAMPPVVPLEIEASTVTLFRSRLSRDGARYEPLTSIELRC